MLIFYPVRIVPLIPHLLLLRIFEHGYKFMMEEEVKNQGIKRKKIFLEIRAAALTSNYVFSLKL